MSDTSDRPVTCPACGALATIPSGFCASCGAKLNAGAGVFAEPAGMNPYAAPSAPASVPSAAYAPAIVARAEAVIKDANQVWLAVLMGFLCTAFTWVLICPWFAYRLHCWSTLSRDCPSLLAPDVLPGSLEAKFQSARGKLVIGLVIGAVMLLMIVGVLVAVVLGDA